MSALMALMDEMAATLETAFAGSPFPIQVVGRRNYNPTPTSVDVYPGDPFRETDQAGYADVSGAYIFTVRARINTPDQDASQDELLRLMDDEDDLCVAAALMDDPTLGGLASSVYVEGPSGYTFFSDLGEQALLGCTWRVVVLNASS